MNPKQHELFSNIRALLQKPPSEENWTLLLELFSKHHPQIQEDRLLPYVRGHLQRWPDTLRPWNKSWIRRFLKGHHVPIAGLAATLTIANRHIHRIDPQATLVHASYLQDIRHLEIQEENLLTLDLLKNWFALPYLQDLHSLHLRSLWINTEEDAQDEFWSTLPTWPNLKYFNNEYGITLSTRAAFNILCGSSMPHLQWCAPGFLSRERCIHLEDLTLSPSLKHMTCYIINTDNPQEETRRDWPAMPWLGSLESLELIGDYKEQTEHNIAHVMAHTKLPKLKELTLGPRFSSDSFKSLITNLALNDSLTSLHTLNLSSWRLERDVLMSLLKVDHFGDALKRMITERYIEL